MKISFAILPIRTLPAAARCAALVFAGAILSQPAQAAFHLWSIREIYSNSSGTAQFIELFCPTSGQTFINGLQISVTPSSGTNGHIFTLTHGISGDSLNHTLLFGTAGAQAAGAPAPDFTIPNNFLFTGGGTISFFGDNSGSYTALPTDGVQSRNWGDGNAVNSPQNYSGQVGVIVPEPATWTMLLAGGIGLGLLLHRRRV